MRPTKSESSSETSQASGRPDELGVRSFEPFITKDEIARRLGLQVRAVNSLMHRGVLRYFKIGKMVRFQWSDVEADMREHLRFCGGRRLSPQRHRGTESPSRTGQEQKSN